MDREALKNSGLNLLNRAYGKWWMMLLEGLCLIVVCALTLFLPDITLSFLVMIFGIYRAAMGVFYLIVGAANRIEYGGNGGFSIGRGIFDLIVGAVFLLMPDTIIKVFVMLVGLWVLITGIVLLVLGGGSIGPGKVFKIVLGIVLILFGIATFINPITKAYFFLAFMGIILGITGVFLVIQSFAMKKSYDRIKKLNDGFKDYEIK